MHISSRFSAQLNRSVKEPVPYSKEALRQNLTRVRIAWEECQTNRERNAIYGYLSAVFDLVMWWKAEDRAISRARWALQLQRLEFVREHQAGLQSFRSMRRIDARRKNASALRLRFSQSLASLRQRLSQAMVRSTTQRRGSTTNPLA